MRFSVFTLAFPGFTAEQAISIAAEIGFDGIDIRTKEDGHIYIDAPKSYRKQLVTLAKSLNIKFYGVYSYLGGGMASLENKIVNEELEKLKMIIDLAVDLEATHVRIFDGDEYNKKPENMRQFIQSCKVACRKAEDANIYLGIETHGNLAWDGECCKRIIEEVGSDNLKIIFDPANMFYYGLNPVVEAEKIKRYILSVQFKDFLKVNNKRRYVLLGNGDVPISQIIDFLKKGRFDGYIVVEYEKWWHPELPDPSLGLRHELQYLKQHFP
jgi:fatty-acyl-CoA synthase